MATLARWFLETRIPISVELVLGMALATGGLAMLGAYLVVLVLGP